MGICDICNKTIDRSEATIISAKEMQTIARNNYKPGGLVGIYEVLGMPDTAVEDWREAVYRDKTPWALCSECYEATRPFAKEQTETRSTDNPPGSKPRPGKWWKF